jgi:type III pantothenate kinase
MYILGDIGNTETKIFLVSKNNKIIKKLTLSTRDINYAKLNRLFINFVVDYKKVKKILF